MVEVGVERDLLQAADAKRGQGVLVLQSPELTLDGSASPVEVAPRFESRGTSARA